MPSVEEELDALIRGPEGKSPYTTQRPRGNQQQKLSAVEDQPKSRGNQQQTSQQESTETENSRPRIRKVSEKLRKNENLEKYYEPKAVPIGLLHLDKNKLSLVEQHKTKLEVLFLKENGLDEFKLRSKIKSQIDKLKRCYVEEDIKRVSINNDYLVSTFLTDGCALLHSICYAANGKLNDLKIGMDMEAFSQHDLFLLENQLPYQVLDIIMTSTADGGANMRNLIDKFINKTARDIRGPSFGEAASRTAPQQPAPAHLLELLWKRLVGDFEKEKAVTGQNQKEKVATEKQQVRKVNELKAAGIQFKSETKGSLRDVSFVAGTLTLPSLVVDDSTAPKLLNLIAFEMCPDFENDFQVSTYISFLHSLIDKPNDVKELRKAHILHSAQRSDEDVTRALFKEIGTNLASIPEAYLDVKDLIQKHCEKKQKTWAIKLFGSRWTFFAFVAAIAVLIMSFSSRLGAPRNLSAE